MPHIKKAFSLLARLVLASIAMSVAYLLSTFVISPTGTPLTPEEASWAGQALFIVSTINALVLAHPILRSDWHGLKLIGVVFLIQFGVETFMTQIETLYFNRSLQVKATEMMELITSGALRALIFAPLAVLVLGKLKDSGQSGTSRAALKLSDWGWGFATLVALYPIIYFMFGYYVAWQWDETRLFYSGTTAILPFLTHFRGLFSSDPYILPFQIMRGALWAALAMLIVDMMKVRRWESALAVALIFAGILSSGIGLFPNPYMPPMVRQSHFFELMSSMLLFGAIAGWTLDRKKQQNRQTHFMNETQNPNVSVEAG